MTNQHGTVDYNGKELTICHQPRLTCYMGYDCYEAMAMDSDDNEYKITWDITDALAEDESDACDWTDYRVQVIA